MNNSVKVSIMLTCYNCEKYIDKAIDSVIAMEKPFVWELLIGDDGSSDGTIARINAWMEQYPDNISLYIMDREQGTNKNGTRAAKNRANLLEKAKGEYLIFLDGDDQFIGKNKLIEQVRILDNPKYNRCSCVGHNIIANNLSSGTSDSMVDKKIGEGVIDASEYWKKLYFHTNTIMFRKKCKKLMLDERYRDFLNDNFITFLMLQYGNIYYLPYSWAQYNLTGDGLWTGKKRSYGCFRNMILYDLEKSINPLMNQVSFIRHLYDFRYLFRNYVMEDRERVDGLLIGLNETNFPFTFLMYKLDDELTADEQEKKNKLRRKVKIKSQLVRIQSHLGLL